MSAGLPRGLALALVATLPALAGCLDVPVPAPLYAEYSPIGELRPGMEVTFRASGVAADLLTIRWDLGDGSIAEGDTVRHAYTSPGRYTVRASAGPMERTLDVPVHDAGALAGEAPLSPGLPGTPEAWARHTIPALQGARHLEIRLRMPEAPPGLVLVDVRLLDPKGREVAGAGGSPGELVVSHPAPPEGWPPGRPIAAGNFTLELRTRQGYEPTPYEGEWIVRY